MNDMYAPVPHDGGSEVAALIEALSATGRRLEELTRGEVDSVVDADGRTFLLRHAQEQLRASDAAKEATILDSLSAHIAMLDRNGTIVVVNEAWRQFANANGLPGTSYAVGSNYFHACQTATGAGSEGATEACTGVNSVLEGRATSFAFEYPCHSPGEERWFRLLATPLAGNPPAGVVVAHVNVTLQKIAELEAHRASGALMASERRFTDLLGNVKLLAVMLDPVGMITYCNQYFLALTGWSSEEVLGRDWYQLFVPPEPQPLTRPNLAAVLSDAPGSRHDESAIRTRSGERRLIRWNNSVLRSAEGGVIGVAGIGEDITEQRAAAVGLERMNRVYAVLSGINSLIVRARRVDELYREACHIACGAGGLRMAMIAVPIPGRTTFAPAAWAGKDEGLMQEVRRMLSTPELFLKTMIARAAREGTTVVSLDSRDDPQLVLGSIYAEAGIRSVAVLPLMVAGTARGVLALYSREPGFFDEEEMKLLSELAGDIAFAIDHIGKQDLLDYLAYYDSLTGLANRTLFLERVAQCLANAAGAGVTPAVFMIDLERFKAINDSLGRPAGDELLRQVAAVLTQAAGDAVRVARLDADRFAVGLPIARSEGDVASFLESTINALQDHRFQVGDTELRIAAKIGVAVFPVDGGDADTLFRNAEAALKNAKGSGERYLFHTRKMTEAVAGKLTLENSLREALEREEFVLHYQPKVSLASGKLTGGEALIRWNAPATGLVPPGRFIPVLEETGLIYDVGRWALRQALRDYLRCKAEGLPAVRIAVNVSPLQLRRSGFVDEIAGIVAIHPDAAAGLELEITESVVMEDVKHSVATLQRIREMGVTVAIDDFGTGFSSLAYLARLPVDMLKIDRSFVVGMTLDSQGLALVSTIINLAHSLKLKVVAEGVETEEQSHLLALLGCDEMQGFLFSKAVPAEDFERRFLTQFAAPVPPGPPTGPI